MSNLNTIPTQVSEQALQTFCEAFYGWYNLPQTTENEKRIAKAEVERSLIRALPHLPLGFEVKQLDWRSPTEESNGCWTAKTVFGTYSVVNENGWYAVLDDQAFGTEGFEWLSKDLSKDTRQTAFNAAQADHNRRVRERITLINEGAKPVGVAAVLRAISSVNIHEEANSFEWRGEGGDYTPQAHEKALLEDFGHGLISLIEDAIRALSAEPAQGEQLPQDVINLVISGRELIYGDNCEPLSEEFNAFDKSLEAFADRVDWDDQPDDAAYQTPEESK